jgi:hypothetical protein
MPSFHQHGARKVQKNHMEISKTRKEAVLKKKEFLLPLLGRLERVVPSTTRCCPSCGGDGDGDGERGTWPGHAPTSMQPRTRTHTTPTPAPPAGSIPRYPPVQSPRDPRQDETFGWFGASSGGGTPSPPAERFVTSRRRLVHAQATASASHGRREREYISGAAPRTLASHFC